jgi:putative flavoprotein involved in K+ transport
MQESVIIGAGPAGLAVAYWLGRLGRPYRIVDENDAIAATWRSRHPALHLNTLRIFSHQPGMRIPRSCGRWVARDDYVRYLEEYCRRFAIPVELQTCVRSIGRIDGGWSLETSRGTIAARNAVISTGGFRVPRMPAITGLETFAGEVLHASAFGAASSYDGRKVLIIGGANSAFDIASHLVRRPLGSLAMSIRTPASIVPRTVFGVPTHLLAVLGRRLPRVLQDRTTALLARIAYGDLSRLALAPPEGAFTRHARDMVTIAVDDGFIDAVDRGDACIVSEVMRIDGPRVTTRDGLTLEPDVILCATGYSSGLEHLVGHLGVLDDLGLPTTAGASANPAHPGLWFLGQRGFIWGNMHEQRRTSRALAEAIAARDRR